MIIICLDEGRRAAGPHYFIEPPSGFNSIDFFKRIFRKRGDVEILARTRWGRRGWQAKPCHDVPPMATVPALAAYLLGRQLPKRPDPRPASAYAMTQRASPTSRSFASITAAIGTILDSFRSQECRNYLANSGCQQTGNHHALGGTSRNSYKTPFAASTMWRAEIPNASTSSSGLPECGIPLTAISLNFVGAAPAATKACKTASPNPPSGQ